MQRRIGEVEIHNKGSFKIGDKIYGKKIAYFEDKSVETNNYEIDSLFLAKDENGELLISIENVPLIVYYYYEDSYKDASEEIEKREELNEQLEGLTGLQKREQT